MVSLISSMLPCNSSLTLIYWKAISRYLVVSLEYNSENGIETCKISCMKRVASLGSMHDTGCLGLVHWDDPEGWYGEGGGMRVQDGEHMYRVRPGFSISITWYLRILWSDIHKWPLPFRSCFTWWLVKIVSLPPKESFKASSLMIAIAARFWSPFLRSPMGMCKPGYLLQNYL